MSIVDTTTQMPISYANLDYLDDKTGTYCNEAGVFATDKIGHRVQISLISYDSKVIVIPDKDSVVYLQPRPCQLDEISVSPTIVKPSIIGFFNSKSDFTRTGISGEELAVFISNPSKTDLYLKEVLIKTDIRKLVKSNLKIDFVSMFKVNFYLKKDKSFEPGKQLQVKSLILTSDSLKRKSAIDISRLKILMPADGIFVSIEWIGRVDKNSKELLEDYKGRIEPFISTTFMRTNTAVYYRNKFKNVEWTMLDKNDPICRLMNKDNYYTPCVGLKVY